MATSHSRLRKFQVGKKKLFLYRFVDAALCLLELMIDWFITDSQSVKGIPSLWTQRDIVDTEWK